jgi:hypothetical protein
MKARVKAGVRALAMVLAWVRALAMERAARMAQGWGSVKAPEWALARALESAAA